ncbi:Enoyl-CoA delta isomerase 2, mitochondrial [Entomortierella beljakovae]|nr:Enoyl-CoA delta isomerase 2, mitochondrial [Entomortierella beljakovae]
MSIPLGFGTNSFQNILVELDTLIIQLYDTGVAVIAFNRPKVYNALNSTSYQHLITALEWAAASDDVRVVVLTGNGKFFTSGQEIPALNSGGFPPDTLDYTLKAITQLIYFPKLIIAAVNGPAVGFGVTSSALCDIVYATPEATFNTPFIQFGRKFSAREMEVARVVARIFPREEFMGNVLKIATSAAKLSPHAMKINKALIRDREYDLLNNQNIREIGIVKSGVSSEQYNQAMLKYYGV